MNFKKFSSTYRKGLDQMMKKRGMVNAAFFKKAEHDIPPSLKVIGLPDTSERQMNCHGFTFRKGGWFKTPKVWQLLKRGDLIPLSRPEQNSIVLYIDVQRETPIIYHSAVYLGKGFVRSKWSNGPIFEHKIFDSPFSYGSNVKFYKLK